MESQFKEMKLEEKNIMKGCKKMTKKGKRRTWRKLLSALLVMNMLLGTMSTSAFAADLTEEPVVEEAAAAQPESAPQLLVSEETVSTPGPEPEVVEEEPVAEVTEEEPAIEVTEEEPAPEVAQEPTPQVTQEEPTPEAIQEEPAPEIAKYTVRFSVNNSDAGVITVDGSSVNAGSYYKDVEEGEDFNFSVTAKEGFDVESVRANGANAEKNGETGYVVRGVNNDTEIAVQYKSVQKVVQHRSVQKAVQAEVSEKKEVPEVVKKFLNTVEQLAALGNVTEENTEEFNNLGQAAMDAYEAVQDAGLEDYEGVEDALMVLMGIADSVTGGTETMAQVQGESFTIKVVKCYVDPDTKQGVKVETKSLTSKCLQSTGHAGYNHSTNIYNLAKDTFGTSGWIGYNWNKNTTVPSSYNAWKIYGSGNVNNDYTSVHYNITGSAPYKADETLYLYVTPPTPEYTVTVRYIYENGATAATTQTSTGKKGSTYSISSPTISGYTPDQATVSGTYTGDKNVTVTYKKEKVTLTYNANGGSNAPTVQTVDKGTSVKIKGKENMTFDNHEFLGWSTDEKATSADRNPDDYMMLNENLILYAVWKPIDDDGGGISVTKTRVSINNNATLTTAKANDVIKWEIKVTNNSNVQKTVTLTELLTGASISPSSLTVEAGNTKSAYATYTVQDADTGTIRNTVKASTEKKGEDKTASDDGTLIVASYKVQWFDKDGASIKAEETREGSGQVSVTDADKNVTEYKFLETDSRNVLKDNLKADGSTVLKLYFEAEKKEVTVTWVDEDGKTVLDGPKTFNKGGEEPKYAGKTPTKEADDDNIYTFAGWDRAEDGAGNVTYRATYTATPKVPVKYFVQRHVRDGAHENLLGDLITREGKVGNKVSVTSEDKKFPGYIFLEEDKNNLEEITLSQNVQSNVLHLYFDKQVTATWMDGYTDTPIKTETVAKNISDADLKVLYPEDPTREKFKFDEWKVECDNDGNITITAQWISIDNKNGISVTKERKSIGGDETKTSAKPGEEIVWNITVTNNSNVTKTISLKEQLEGADLSKDEVTLEAGASETITATYTVKDTDAMTILKNTVNASTGDKGDNENPSATDKGTQIDPVDPAETVTATWKNGYTDTPIKTETVAKDITDEVLQRLYPEDPARDGFDFDGWEVERDPDGNITITAQWKPTEEPEEEVTATWRDGYTDTPIKTETVAKDITDEVLQRLYPENPTRDGFDFDGWEVERDSDGNITITAQWKPKEEPKEEVTATWNDGYTDTPIKTEPVAKDITDEDLRDLYPEDPTREGYNFDGWEVERDPDGNITITAQWTAVTPVPTPEDPTPENPTPENPTPGNPGTTTPGATTPVETPVTPGAPAVTPIAPAVTPIAPTATPAAPAPTAPVTPVVTPVATVPTPTPVTPAVTPAALTPVTPALTPNAEAATPGGQTEIQAVPDDETPLANADLEDEEVPLAGNSDRWALINFALMNLSVFESLMLLIGYFIQTKKSSEEEEEEEDEKERKLKKKGIIRIVSLPIAIISLIAFFLTENIWLPTRLVDQYTLMMAVIAVIQTIMVVLSRKEEVTEEEEPEAEMA